MTNQTEMKCWVSGDTPGIAELRLTEMPIPVPKRGEILVRVDGAALNFSDILMIDDRYQVRPERPFVPGQEVSGTVVASGDNSRWNPGDRIASKVFWGGFAEYVCVRDDMAIAIPQNLGAAEGAALPVVYMTAMVALHHSVSVKADDIVLVHAAAGGVGLAAVEIAHAAGATVIATAGSSQKLELAQKHGADHLVNYRDRDWTEQVRTATGSRGATIIVDPVGGDIARQSLRCLARYGTLLIVGFASGTIAELPSNRLLLNSLTVKGVLWDHDRDGPMIETLSERLLHLAEQGKINPVVNTRYTLEELPDALQALANRETSGKLVLSTGSTAT